VRVKTRNSFTNSIFCLEPCACTNSYSFTNSIFCLEPRACTNSNSFTNSIFCLEPRACTNSYSVTNSIFCFEPSARTNSCSFTNSIFCFEPSACTNTYSFTNSIICFEPRACTQCLRSRRMLQVGASSQRSSPVSQTYGSVTAVATSSRGTTSPSRSGTSTWTHGPWRRTRCTTSCAASSARSTRTTASSTSLKCLGVATTGWLLYYELCRVHFYVIIIILIITKNLYCATKCRCKLSSARLSATVTLGTKQMCLQHTLVTRQRD